MTVTAVSGTTLWYNVVFQAPVSNKLSLFTNFVKEVRYRSTTAISDLLIVEVALRAGDELSRTYVLGENISPNAPPPVMYCNPFYDYWAFILLICAEADKQEDSRGEGGH